MEDTTEKTDDSEKMLKKFPEYIQAVEDILALGSKPGELITHEWLDEHLGLDPHAKGYSLERFKRISAFRKELLTNHQIDTKCVTGQGYYIVAPQDQTSLALDDTAAAIRAQVAKGLTRVINTKRAALDDAGRAENDSAISALGTLGPMIAQGIKRGRRIPANRKPIAVTA